MDTVPTAELRNKVEASVAGTPGVLAVEEMQPYRFGRVDKRPPKAHAF
jgi:hypothetical protein